MPIAVIVHQDTVATVMYQEENDSSARNGRSCREDMSTLILPEIAKIFIGRHEKRKLHASM